MVAFQGVDLLSTRRLQRIDGAFPLIAVEDFLPTSSYTALACSFPEEDGRWVQKRKPGDTKWDLASNIPAFSECLADFPAWRAFVDEISSHAFIRDLLELIMEPMRECARLGDIPDPNIENAISTSPSADALADRIVEEGEILINLSVMRRGDFNTPHSDGTRKILSLLTYFPVPGWEAAFGGGTEFYSLRRNSEESEWFKITRNRIAPSHLNAFVADATLRHIEPFEGNRAILFGKTRRSFHGVRSIECPPHISRRVCQLSLKL